jgi:DNA-binding CsgD family transcriptional regulator
MNEVMNAWEIIRPPVYICSRHPIAFGAIKKLLLSAMYEARTFEQIPSNLVNGQNWILVLDTCSIKDWIKIATQWGRIGGRSIVLVPKRLGNGEEESRFIYLGIHAIILMANFETELPRAVDAIAKERFWIGREALNACVRHSHPFINFVGSRSFTGREQQIIPFLMTASSNKEIANALHISERTVKFHVSNILRKFNVKSRRALRKAHTAGEPLLELASA